MSSIENTNDIDVLRRRLQAVEEEIIRIAKPFDHIMSDAEEELVCEHLSIRSYILNRNLLRMTTYHYDYQLFNGVDIISINNKSC